jgi:nitroreductase
MQRMDFETLVQTRRSVRGFKKQPVQRAVIEEVIEVAKRAPSSMNTQPWHIHVLTGEPLQRVRQRNMDENYHGEYYQGVRTADLASRHRQKLFADGDRPRRQADAMGLGVARFSVLTRRVSPVLAYD